MNEKFMRPSLEQGLAISGRVKKAADHNSRVTICKREGIEEVFNIVVGERLSPRINMNAAEGAAEGVAEGD